MMFVGSGRKALYSGYRYPTKGIVLVVEGILTRFVKLSCGQAAV